MTKQELEAKVAELETQLTTATAERDAGTELIAQISGERDRAHEETERTIDACSDLRRELASVTDERDTALAKLAFRPAAKSADADDREDLQVVLRRNGLKVAYVAPDGGTFFDEVSAHNAVKGAVETLTTVTLD